MQITSQPRKPLLHALPAHHPASYQRSRRRHDLDLHAMQFAEAARNANIQPSRLGYLFSLKHKSQSGGGKEQPPPDSGGGK